MHTVLSHLPVASLTAQCHAASARSESAPNTAIDRQSCLELFRRLFGEDTAERLAAQTALWQIYAIGAVDNVGDSGTKGCAVQRWVIHAAREIGATNGTNSLLDAEALDDIVTNAAGVFFRRFQPQHLAHAEQAVDSEGALKMVLGFWSRIARNALIDYLRDLRKSERSIAFADLTDPSGRVDSDSDPVDPAERLVDTHASASQEIECEELKDQLLSRVLSHCRPGNLQDKLIVRGRFVHELSPDQIFETFQQHFKSITEVYDRIKRFRQLHTKDVVLQELRTLFVRNCL